MSMSVFKKVKSMIAQGFAAEEICRETGIPLQHFWRWQQAEHAKRLRALEKENQLLKSLLSAAMSHAHG